MHGDYSNSSNYTVDYTKPEIILENKDSLVVKGFLVNPDLNLKYWKVDKNTLSKNVETFINKPIVLTASYDHPTLTEEYFRENNLLGKQITTEDVLRHSLIYQKPFEVGTIIDIQKTANTNDYFATYVITDPEVRRLIKHKELPLYLSPGIIHLDPFNEIDTDMKTWSGFHLAIVDSPAYGKDTAYVKAMCEGDVNECIPILKTASAKYNSVNNWDRKTIVDNLISKRIKNSSLVFSNTNKHVKKTMSESNQEQIKSNNNKLSELIGNAAQEIIKTAAFPPSSEKKESSGNNQSKPQNNNSGDNQKGGTIDDAVNACVMYLTNNSGGQGDPEQIVQVCQQAFKAIVQVMQNQAPQQQGQNNNPQANQVQKTASTTDNEENNKGESPELVASEISKDTKIETVSNMTEEKENTNTNNNITIESPAKEETNTSIPTIDEPIKSEEIVKTAKEYEEQIKRLNDDIGKWKKSAKEYESTANKYKSDYNELNLRSKSKEFAAFLNGKIPEAEIESKSRLFAERNFEISDIESLFASSNSSQSADQITVEKVADCGCNKKKKADPYSKVKLVAGPSTITKTASDNSNENLTDTEIYKNLNLNLARAIMEEE